MGWSIVELSSLVTTGPALGLGDNEILALGLDEADGLCENDELALGLVEADGLALALGEPDALGDNVADADALGESEALGLSDALGEIEGDLDALGESEVEGLVLALGEVEALGEREAEGLMTAYVTTNCGTSPAVNMSAKRILNALVVVVAQTPPNDPAKSTEWSAANLVMPVLLMPAMPAAFNGIDSRVPKVMSASTILPHSTDPTLP